MIIVLLSKKQTVQCMTHDLEFFLKLFRFDYNEKARKEHESKIKKFLEKYPDWKYEEDKARFISPKGTYYSLLLLLEDILEDIAKGERP